MKQIILLFVFTLFCFFGTDKVLASPDIGTGTGGMAQGIAKKIGFGTNTNEYTLAETIGRVIRIALTFVGTIFFALMVYSGFLWMTAQGNDEQVAKAKKIISTASIGMIVVVAAYSITAFVMIFTASSTTF